MIKTGDIISFFSSHETTWFHKVTTEFAIRLFTGSKIFHTGIAIWQSTDSEERRLMCVEAVGSGRRISNMSNFQDMAFEVTSIPPELDIRAVEEYALNNLGAKYGWWDLIVIGVREFFGLKVKEGKTVVCSEAAAKAWQAGGMQFDTTVLSPGKLRNVLFEKGIAPSILVNPDQRT
jgi:hypothetical protein